MSEPPLLEVRNLSLRFGKFRALSNVSLKVYRGRLSALIGPNGSGKTTFYNVVSGRYRPTEGRIFFEGRDVSGISTRKLVGRGLLRSFQVTNIFPDLTVLENVLTPLVVHHRLSLSFLGAIRKRRDLIEEAEHVLNLVGLTAASRRIAGTLAHGDRRLVEIAIVLARSPKLVLLDEPTAGMNPEETDRMVELVKELADKSGTTFFITEHDMKVVSSAAERIFVMNQGRMLAQGTPDEIRTSRAVKEAYLGGRLDASSR